jgi:hypothetical protein
MSRIFLPLILIFGFGFNSAFANVEIYDSQVLYFVEQNKALTIQEAKALLQSASLRRYR